MSSSPTFSLSCHILANFPLHGDRILIYDNPKYQGIRWVMRLSRENESSDSQRDFYRQITESIRVLKRNDQMLHNLMLMEFWSIVRTMDELNTGFWSQYMKNHQQVSQQRLKQWQAEKEAAQTQRSPSFSRSSSPFESEEEAKNVQQQMSERIALFSDIIGDERSPTRRQIRESSHENS
ncbi:MAG: hypothetical protein J7545_21805 [Roseofilum sp. SBFL]|uniref:hypothetical protein n=1 Tax=unclassified Roseofilum TaxID=2620099 RepID=UPI001B1E8C63|nr:MULTISPECIES: hypothetical protein [unclassified Roseofilum]MBP0026172.1 hypothetical protein [Roseofilum sp. SID2]MBP0036438.1 hypothetical protein [Roseofilum sp. SID1]MBP0044574.1 hypothetical protein [Roseofilum sp. SBFL]